jgi:hypothetical protein
MRGIFAIFRFIICYSPYKKYKILDIKNCNFTCWDYWVFGICPSSCILKNTTFRKLDLVPSSGEGMGDTYSVGSFFETFLVRSKNPGIPGFIHHRQNHLDSTCFFTCCFIFIWNLISHTKVKNLGLKVFRTQFRKRYLDSRGSDKTLEKSEWGDS